MRGGMACLAVTLVLVFSAVCHGAGLRWDRLHQEVEATSFDESVTLRFACRNTQAEAIRIRNVSKSCGCTHASIDPLVIQPGESGVMTAIIDVSKMAGAGTFDFHVDSSDGSISNLSAQVIAPAVGYFTPARLHWQVGGGRHIQEIRFVPLRGKAIERYDLDFDGSVIRARIRSFEEDGSLRIEVHPLSTGKPAAGRIFVFAKERSSPCVRMHVNTTFVHNARNMNSDAGNKYSGMGDEGQPRVVAPIRDHVLQGVVAGAQVSCKFIVRNDGDGILSISHAARNSSSTSLVIHGGPVLPGEEAVVEVCARLPGYDGGCNFSIPMLTNDPCLPSFSFRVHGYTE